MSTNEEIQTTVDKIVQYSPDYRMLANLLPLICQHRFKCASIKTSLWYEFKNHRWNKINISEITKLAIDELKLVFSKGIKYAYTNEIITSLNKNKFQNSIINEYANISYDPDFLNTLDKNTNLLCFDNGIYELTTGIFRDGLPGDYISLCTNHSYVKPTENVLKEIHDFLNKTQPDPEMKKYVVTASSTCLSGPDDNSYILTGGGSGGKSKFMELLKCALGDYFKTTDANILVAKYPSPELAIKKGIRVCSFDEPNTNEKIDFTRSGVTSFLICNKLPNINPGDTMHTKVKIIPFNSIFSHPSKLSYGQLPKNHFYADLNLSKKINEWGSGFIYMLIDAHKDYLIHGLQEPDTVTQYMNKYRQSCDVYHEFITDSLEKTTNINDEIAIVELYDLMRSWYKSNYDGKCPNRADLRNYLENRDYYYNRNNILCFYKIKSVEVKLPCEKLANPIDIVEVKLPCEKLVNPIDIESMSNHMKLNKISKIQIVNGKTIVEYDF